MNTRRVFTPCNPGFNPSVAWLRSLSQPGASGPTSVGELSVEGHLDALDLVAQFDGGAQLQVHALLHGGQREQQQGLAVDVLQRGHGQTGTRRPA